MVQDYEIELNIYMYESNFEQVDSSAEVTHDFDALRSHLLFKVNNENLLLNGIVSLSDWGGCYSGIDVQVEY